MWAMMLSAICYLHYHACGQRAEGACLEEPEPGAGVDGLAHGAQDAQGGPVVVRHKVVVLGLQRSHQRGRRVELAHLQRHSQHSGTSLGTEHPGVPPAAQAWHI